jgi:hypothetical protein
MRPLTLFDSLATPLYAAFDSTATNSAPYDAVMPSTDLSAKNPNTAANRRFTRGLNLIATDRVPQRVLDRQLWRAVHGPRSTPPKPGPNAQGEGAADGDG